MAARREDAKVVSVRLTDEEQSWIRQYSSDADLSMSQIIRRALKLYKTEIVDKEKTI